MTRTEPMRDDNVEANQGCRQATEDCFNPSFRAFIPAFNLPAFPLPAQKPRCARFWFLIVILIVILIF